MHKIFTLCKKNHRNILCGGTLLHSVQLWLKLDSYCSFITKPPVDTVRMIGVWVWLIIFLLSLWPRSPFGSSGLQGEWTSICLVIATKCWLSGGIRPTQGWQRQKVSGNCCQKQLRAITSGNRLSNTLFSLMTGAVLLVPPTSDLGWKTRTSTWQAVNFLHCFCAGDFILIAQKSQVQGTPTLLFLLSSLYIARRNTVNPNFSLHPKWTA